MPLPAEKVRASAKAIFETAFPPCGYATEDSLKSMADMLSPAAESFDCPLGGTTGLTKPTAASLFQWFKDNFDPVAMKYTEWIDGDIMVSGNTASFHKGFFLDTGKGCVQASALLILEVDDDGKLVRWIDHYDTEDLGKKLELAAKFNE